MRFLITGTAGFIGFHLAQRLLTEGHAVTGFDGLTPYYDVALKQRRHAILAEYAGFTPVIGMLEDIDALARAGAVARPDIIIHLAAQAGVRYGLENPASYIQSNVVGSWNVLELARQLRPAHLMLASTSSVYGANDTEIFRETDRADEPLSIYAATKKSVEAMAHSYAHLHKVPTTAMRFFTVYGPWGRPDMALFKFVDALLNDRPIEIYGDGSMTRDFTYVNDVVEAVVRLTNVVPDEGNRATAPGLTDTLSHQAPFRTVNIGGGQPVVLMRFVEMVEAAVGRPAKRLMLPVQQGDVPATHASAALLQALTGFVPAIGLETGVKAFVEWYRQDYAGVKPKSANEA
ncbi:MAG: NAD-dependent epimerase/dehydratase family protein [Rhizobiaceae bacterium]|nr:MAG: NAD-dependent epimerase/dehydratase family protein [Rhizobiaceae bacterium]